ncbi:MAG: hypothetical protein O2979_03625 [Proteobacteria bacterium]|nr:hypothetical protein [Pseudomonadota bacterium]
MNATEELSPEEAQRLAMLAEMGHAAPDDVRRLLCHMCEQVESRRPIDPWTARFLANGFRAYLQGLQTLQAALGFVRKKRGRKSALESKGQKIRWIAAEGV